VNLQELNQLYDMTGRTVVITGGAGVLGREMASALVGCNATVVILDCDQAVAEQAVEGINRTARHNGRVMAVRADVLQRETLEKASQTIRSECGEIYALINAAGGNRAKATTSADLSFFDLPEDALRFVFDLNILGTLLSCQVLGKSMAERGEGVILNISSMNAFRPLTRTPAYAAAKAGISNFTQWLAVHMAQEYSSRIRVNALAPGFFLTEQNRYLLTDKETGGLTARGQAIIAHTPMGRFGSPEDLPGTVLWLLSPASAFVTGVVVPIDGGFSAYSGV
jgi:NAD(P)-dependent dehydrogenase (short-subunit alcohol dehydrogenase family)